MSNECPYAFMIDDRVKVVEHSKSRSARDSEERLGLVGKEGTISAIVKNRVIKSSILSVELTEEKELLFGISFDSGPESNIRWYFKPEQLQLVAQ